jgi:hypothetical protein
MPIRIALRLPKRLLITFAACLGAALAPSAAAACPLGPAPVWSDYAGFGVKGYPVESVLSRPNVTLAVGTEAWAQEYEADGALTVGWHMHLTRLIGKPSSPNTRAAVMRRVPGLVQLARANTSCDPPWLVLNEMLAARLPEPLTRAQLRYRDNLYVLARELKERGVQPVVLLPRVPLSKTRYRSYWRRLSWKADLVYEAYAFRSRIAIARGEIGGRRYLQELWTDAMSRLRPFVVSPRRMGIMIPYWSKHPVSGRVGLSDPAWFRLTRMKVRAAKNVAAAKRLGTIFSWGWGTNPTSGERDPDKPKTACVYLNERNPALCDPAAM